MTRKNGNVTEVEQAGFVMKNIDQKGTNDATITQPKL